MNYPLHQPNHAQFVLNGFQFRYPRRAQLPILVALGLLPGCTFSAHKLQKSQLALVRNQEKISEEVRVLTTGIVDTLAKSPTNEFVNVAALLAKSDQLLVGAPASRLDIDALIANQKNARESLAQRLHSDEALLAGQIKARNAVQEHEAVLIEKGLKYEAQQNRTIIRRLWHWSIATLGIGGLIGICILFPALIPLVAQVFGWIVSKLPSLASAFGVVSHHAFDAIVTGVGQVRQKLKQSGDSRTLDLLDTELGKATDSAHRTLIQHRRSVLRV